MPQPSSQSAQNEISNPRPLPEGPLSRYPWLTFLLPFVVYMAFTSFEPTPDKAGGTMLGLSIEYRHYPIVYTVKIVATLLAMAFVWPGYRTFPLRISWLAPLVGIIGVVVWVLLCEANLEKRLLGPLGIESLIDLGERPAFNPLERLKENPAWAYGFLAIRFVGLVLVVPIIEEFFLRGFVMRFVMDQEWWKVPFGQVTSTAIVVAAVIPMLSHPAEMFAALVWFSLVTVLMVRTKNMWDCVIAHAVTNLLLGIYVVAYGKWTLM